MGMIDRYKKKGGFIQLLQLLETSGPKKRDQFLALIKEESPTWEQALSAKILSVEKVFSWNTSTLQEIFTRIQPLTVVTILKSRSEEVRNSILMGFSMQDQRRFVELIRESGANLAEVATCEHKLLTEVRALISSGHIKIEKIAPELVVGNDIESELDGSAPSVSASSSSSADISSASDDIEALKNAPKGNSAEVEDLKKKLIILSKEIQNLRAENVLLKGKLDQIKKIA